MTDTPGILIGKITAHAASLVQRHDAYASLVADFQDMAYACAYARLGDPHLSQDAAQEAFFTAWKKLHQLREPDAFPGWFRQIVLNEASRLGRNRAALSPLDEHHHKIAANNDPQQALEKTELTTTVRAAIATLPINERVVVTLFYLGGRSHKDISALLGLPLTTVAKRLYSARARLKGSKLIAAFRKDLAQGRPSRNSTFADKVRNGLYDDYVGKYRFELRAELVVTIRREGDRLIGEAAGQVNNLSPNGRKRTELKTAEFDGRGRFVRNRRGRVSHMVYYEFGQELGTAKKIA